MDLTRRQFAASLAAAGTAAAQDPQRLNLLIVTNDQLRGDCIGAAGNRVIQTPNMDRLAGEGVYFDRHYVQCPQCVPSRGVMHTGRYPHINRTPTNLYRLPDDEETLARVLGRNGYRTATVGDMPFAPTKALAGFQEVVASNGEYNAYLSANGWDAKAREHNEAIKTNFQAVPAPWPEDQDETAFFAGKAIGFLRENRDRPFFLHVNFRRPHHPFNPPPPFDKMYSGAAFPASHKRDGEMRNKPASQQKSIENSVGFDLRTMTPRDLGRIKSYYYGMISLNDRYVGHILEELKRSGLDRRTVVVCNADHGEMLGDHGLLFKGGYMYDEVVRVPLILRAPQLPAGKRISGMVETADLYPTLMDLLKLPKSARVQGRSLLPLIEGKDKGARAVHAEFPGTKMFRTEDWKLVHYLHAPLGELYNLKEDPHELYNRYDDPTCAGTKSELLARLTDWLIDTQDPALPPLKV